jgi:hypothetical protein
MHHAGLWVEGCLHFHLHGCKVIHPSLESSDPLHRVLPNQLSGGWGEALHHSNPLKQVHIVYTSVTKLSMVERLILLHLLGATDGNVVTVRGHRNIIMCKIVDRPPGLVRWRHEGPCGVLWSITGAWARALAGRVRWECLLHSTYQFLHLAQYLQQQHTTTSTKRHRC